MMTPEEIQRTMDFILASQANSAVRMDRFEGNLDRLEADLDRLKEEVDGLKVVVRDLLVVSQGLVERSKRQDSVDETLKVLRELLEANLRRPDNPSP